MLTFSAPPTEATLLPGLVNVVSVLPDNTAKEISPKDVRDAVYTLWHNTILKPTTITGSTTKYIGIDQYQLVDSPSGASIYPKMLLGKKQASGQFIMNDDLLNTDIDFFFYNMKNNQSVGNYDTTIAFLAGTGSFMKNNAISAPTIKSVVVSDAVLGNYINLNINNSSFILDATGTQTGGDINITSNNGYVTINNFHFPKLSQITSANNDYVLKYKWVGGAAYGVWESAFSQSITTINSAGQVTITGNPVVISGFNFTDANVVGTAIGGISVGETFSNVSVMDMFRRIIYTYIPPIVDAGFRTNLSGPNKTIIEMGDSSYSAGGSLRLFYTLTVNSTHSVTQIGFVVPSGGSVQYEPPLPGGGVLSNEQLPRTPVKRGYYYNRVRADKSLAIPPGEAYTYITYTFSVTDSLPTTRSSKAEMVSVLPYFYGTLALQYTDGAALQSFLHTNETPPANKLAKKLVFPIIGSPTSSNNVSVNISTIGLGPSDGQGFIYFGYPSQFPLLLDIRDNNVGNGYSVLDRFLTYSLTISTPQWSTRPYTFYILKEITSVPLSTVPWRFLFATQSS